MWKTEDKCFFVVSRLYVVEGKVLRVAGDFLVIRYGDGKGTQLRSSKVYHTEDEAMAQVRHMQPVVNGRRKNQYDYM